MSVNVGFEFFREEGVFLVGLARDAIEMALLSEEMPIPSDVSEKLTKEYGVFVTLNKQDRGSHSLRGCIGLPYPVKPLTEAIIDSAVNAALNDPRFPPVSLKEMDSIIVEVSILTPPQKLDVEVPKDIPDRIEVGVDGLIISRGNQRGLLLPQVAVDWGWDAEEFLTQCCLKAWLQPDAWILLDTKISKFQTIIFSELEPRGTIEQVVMDL
jgi:uncharacterized protein (TIGR00296 family)